jgi:transcriptional regulator with XRE-family HTH domain
MPHPFISSVREIREKAKYSQTAAAALAGVAPGTWVRYELDRGAVSNARRESCDQAAAKLLEIARQRTEAA